MKNFILSMIDFRWQFAKLWFFFFMVSLFGGSSRHDVFWLLFVSGLFSLVLMTVSVTAIKILGGTNKW